MIRFLQDLVDRFRRGDSSKPDSVPPQEIRDEIDELARRNGFSAEEALRRLEAGQLDGTPLEVALRMRLFLLGEDAPLSSALPTSGSTPSVAPSRRPSTTAL